MKLNICIDIDGTITEPYYWLPIANEYFDKNIKPHEVNQYEIYEVLNIPREDYLSFYKLYGEQLHSKAEVREDARQILSKLNQLHNVFYITAREAKLEKTTTEWFDRNNLPKGELYLLGSHYKVDKAKELNCNIFIEDRYENAIQVAGSGLHVLLIDCYYNRKPLIPGITRVFNWKDIYKFIKEFNIIIDEGVTEIA